LASSLPRWARRRGGSRCSRRIVASLHTARLPCIAVQRRALHATKCNDATTGLPGARIPRSGRPVPSWHAAPKRQGRVPPGHANACPYRSAPTFATRSVFGWSRLPRLVTAPTGAHRSVVSASSDRFCVSPRSIIPNCGTKGGEQFIRSLREASRFFATLLSPCWSTKMETVIISGYTFKSHQLSYEWERGDTERRANRLNPHNWPRSPQHKDEPSRAVRQASRLSRRIPYGCSPGCGCAGGCGWGACCCCSGPNSGRPFRGAVG
jgi:hypothetical protein